MAGWVEGRVALVTGASRGIGAGIATRLAAEGAKVAVAARGVEGLQTTCRRIEADGGEAMAVPTDVAHEDQIERMVRAVEGSYGPVDILVNNAGTMGGPDFTEHYPETRLDWEAAYRVNTLARVHAAEAVLPSMAERRWGRIVNVSSVAGLEGYPVHLAYNSTRAAEINYTQALAREVGKHNVTVNAVLPGLIYTDISVTLWRHVKRKYGGETGGDDPKRWFDGVVQGQVPLKRAQTVDDVGWLVAFLCSERARNVTGQAINVDGGMRPH